VFLWKIVYVVTLIWELIFDYIMLLLVAKLLFLSAMMTTTV